MLKSPENDDHGDEKKIKIVFWSEKTIGATDPKLGMHIQLRSGSKKKGGGGLGPPFLSV